MHNKSSLKEEYEPAKLVKSSTVTANYDTSKWSVVPFKPDVVVDTPSTVTTNQLDNESCLTWWKDPENPSERLVLDNM
jgi:hypothetical protein